ncbi:hypothetical protein HPB51_000301 [Rhipicephalus microplus]|uniref:Uncharacterized protein n=1 Tax=Rhipicephalus microplus TaxID=6941 RepID=A0A9J6EPI3_RHIMP|nr:hypothetical protein HPB51_000301 [Rhipicephalus microplus]
MCEALSDPDATRDQPHANLVLAVLLGLVEDTAEYPTHSGVNFLLLLISHLCCSVKYLPREIPESSHHFVCAIRSEGWGKGETVRGPPAKDDAAPCITTPLSIENSLGLAQPLMRGDDSEDDNEDEPLDSSGDQRRVVYVSSNVHFLGPALQDIFASALPLNASKDFKVQLLKQQNFTSLCQLLKHRFSRNALQYMEHRLAMATLTRLPRLMHEAPCSFRQPVELSLVCVLNEDDRSVVVVPAQEAHLRQVAQRPPNSTHYAQVRVIELCKSTLTLRLVSDSRLYKLVTRQQWLESEMCFQHCIAAWAPFDLLHVLACGQTVKILFLTKVLVSFLVGYKGNLVDYTACSLARLLEITTALPHRASYFRLTGRVSLGLIGQDSILPL